MTDRTEPAFVHLVVPVYSEYKRFAERTQELAEFICGFPIGSELLIVDDGSTDRTAEMVEAFLADGPHLRTRLLRRPHEGKGSTVRAGLKAVSAEYAGFCDVDLSTQLDQLELILEPACAGLCRPSAPARRLLPAC